jgi:hypothetical protein
MIRKVVDLNEKHEKSDNRIRQKKAEYIRVLQRRDCIKRFYITRKGKIVNSPKTKDGHRNFLAYDEDELKNYEYLAQVGRPRKEK